MAHISPRIRWPERFNDVPKEIFYRHDVYRLELERIFYGENWHPVVHRAEIPKPGDYKTATVGETSLRPAGPFDVETQFMVAYTTARGQSEILATGVYHDEVSVDAGGAKFRAKRAVLDTLVTPRYLVYPI